MLEAGLPCSSETLSVWKTTILAGYTVERPVTPSMPSGCPASQDLLVRAAERGANLGAITHGLMRLLDRYGAADLQAAIREALERDVPHPDLFKLLMTKVTQQNENSVLNDFTNQMRRVSLVGAVQATNQPAGPTLPTARAPVPSQPRPMARAAPQPPLNSLFLPLAQPQPMRQNSLMR